MATQKNKFRDKPADETVADERAFDKNDIEETVSTSSKNKAKSTTKNSTDSTVKKK